MGKAVPWRHAMDSALYGDEGFYTRSGGGAGGHFRTSAHASPLFATAILRVIAAMDETLGQPDHLDVVDIGAGGGHLLRRLAALAPTYLDRRLRLSAIEVAPRPPDLPERIGWYRELPPAGAIAGVVLATEWLDNVPLDVAETGTDGVLRYLLVDASGAESVGEEISSADAAWAHQWWSHAPRVAGSQVELGLPRDEAWATAVSAVSRGLALTVDYGHMWYDRPAEGTLAGFYAGRVVPPVPDGSCDITAHVAIDSACAAGEVIAGQAAALVSQHEALRTLGLSAARPSVELASTDPAGYVRALSQTSQAMELMDPTGLGGHYWIIQPVGITADSLPVGLRP